MQANGKSPGVEEKCPKCGKRIVSSDRAGSITAYFSQPFNCNCHRQQASGSLAGGRPGGSAPVAGAGKKTDLAEDYGFCPSCGLRKQAPGAAGSITGFLFQDTRCKCRVDDKVADRNMAEKFWRLKADEADRANNKSGGAGRQESTHIQTALDLRRGAIIGGAYRIEKLIGRGGMGEIYLARHVVLDKECALKLIPPDQVTESSWLRFQNEAKSVAGLDHANLVKVTDLGVHEGCLPYYAMEYVEGESLSEMLSSQEISLPVVLDIFIQICNGVDYAHRHGLVHRDLKPANIMLIETAPGKYQVKILDFGLVKLTRKDRNEQSLTAVGEVFGSPFYMSPEQCAGEKIDNRSDIYSLGSTLFECLAGRPPFIGASPVEIVVQQASSEPPTLASIVGPKVYPESLDLVLAKLLRKNPVERYQTLLELKGDLERVMRGEAVEPFYHSRSKLAGESLENSSRFQDRSVSAEVSPAASRLTWWWPAAALLVLAPLLLLVGRSINKPAPAPASSFVRPPTVGLISVMPPQGEKISTGARPASTRDTTPYASVAQVNGKSMRVFNFPTDRSIGFLRSPVGPSSPCKGRITCRLDYQLEFVPDQIVYDYPVYVSRFRKGDIYRLSMPNGDIIGGHGGDQLLAVLTALPGVRNLDLGHGDDLTDKCLPSIEKFTDLNQLTIGTSDMTPRAIAGLSILKRLATLTLVNRADDSAILEKLAGSSNLKIIDFSRARASAESVAAVVALPQIVGVRIGGIVPAGRKSCQQIMRALGKARKLKSLGLVDPVPAEDLAYLESCPDLEKIILPIEGSPEALRHLSKVPQLKRLFVDRLPVSPELLKILSTFPRLEFLQILIADNQTAFQLQQLLPRFPGWHLEPFEKGLKLRLRKQTKDTTAEESG